MKNPFFCCLIFLLIFNVHTFNQSRIDNYNYRAAKYSFIVDYSIGAKAFPELQTMMSESNLAFVYYLQYGKDTLIELLDPGSKFFSGLINVFDYSHNKMSSTSIIDIGRSYFTINDSIPYRIEKSRCEVTNLCLEGDWKTECDSVTIEVISSKTAYKVYFDNSIENLPAGKLFYPDISYLPNKISRLGKHEVTFNLEEMMYGKPALDSLIMLFDYKGYEEFSLEKVSPSDLQFVNGIIEKIICAEED